ncbi:TonB-linked SusC/RagA family outer membrane protein [Pedobacter sp. AK017]|uniref:SusC/RagA family TonB-linked outer membrane protein n=1 Tax=Pedobacter sp. AK017 TaxID=2723073 RepID=UPI001614B35C|nr:SusC/RagA family TonB-linked outer membrane protein [Pedobacter sp. AK017]MBB5437691.1 TonB-linked SusC/RagA family outer membrane protein [Pedobacter sp. AK017]
MIFYNLSRLRQLVYALGQPLLSGLAFCQISEASKRRIIMRAKLTILIITVCFMHVSAIGHAQRITLSKQGTSLNQVFKEIRKQTGMNIIWPPEKFNEDAKINVSVKNMSLDEALSQILAPVNLTYAIKDKTIVIQVRQAAGRILADTLKIVTGKVVDLKGIPLPGIGIKHKETNTATTTNAEGIYQIKVPNKGTLIFTYVGFKTQEIPVAGKTTINIKLLEEQKELSEVVVVGYGTQKKVNLTGAVDQVGKEVFENRPLTSTTKGLQGVIPNLNIRMTDGKPTRTSSYNVRGTTSIGAGGSALVLIDGVPGNPDLVNPNDIESVTVLKDAASAAIYGARGSFGVVLITTKAPAKEKATINYTSGYSLNYQTIRPDLVTEGYPWAQVFNDAFSSWNDYSADPQKANSVFPWSQEYLKELKRRYEAGIGPSTEIDPATGKYIYYGSTDWLKELYADNTPSMEQQISVSGSSDKTAFYISGRYNNQGGIFRYNPDKFNQYNLRAKGSIQATSWLKIENDITFNQRDYFFPILNHASNTPVWRRISDEAFPVAMLRNPDGTLTDNASIVFGSFISGNNFMNEANKQTRNTSRVFTNFLDNKLKINGDFTFDKTSFNRRFIYSPVPYSTAPNVFLERGINKMNNLDQDFTYLALNTYGEYSNSFGKHNFTALLGYNYEQSTQKDQFVERDNLINPEFPDFSLVDGQNFILTGGGNKWITLGGFFRVNYNYAGKYLFEVNGRYDGSSKFPEGQQYGFFPSFSGGWRVSEEPFWKSIKNTVNEFKLRASYGSLGNGNIDPYQFLQTMGVTRSPMVLGGIRPNYTQLPNVIPDGLTWEKATTTNLGADISLFRNRLTTNFDWYIRRTTDMFTVGLPLPATFGAAVPKGNYADLKTTGWELSIGWRDKINTSKPIGYDFRFTLSDSQSTIERFNNPLNLITTYYPGMKVGEIWGFVNDGYFIDQNDINTHANQSLIKVSAANKPLPGDIKFKDLNGDNIINQGTKTLSDPGDQKVIGNSSIRYQYGFNANFDWNNFSFGVFFQGVGKRDYMPTADNSLFWGPYNRPYSWHPKDVVENMWSPENPNAYYPRLRGYTALNAGGELTYAQTQYLQNAAYIRLKNLSVGYNLPSGLIKKIHLSALRVYLTGQNLWVWSPMFKHTKNMDPENIEQADPELNKNAGQGMAYPMLKTYTIGLNVTL